VNAAVLNCRLILRCCPTNVHGMTKMNDIHVFAVRSFAPQNLLLFMTEEHSNHCGICYQQPFVLWHAAISIAGFDPPVRLDLWSISLQRFLRKIDSEKKTKRKK
jgi:hypothetical protein